ncbi:MAG: Wzz/FepE/Etk N-terminal domain-containing protein [Nitrococcus sp.]|nr:Wzz/FepE/Etk N-terminal domain-containing protein [Nitrococcus sp.]
MNDHRNVARQDDAAVSDAGLEAPADDEISLFDLWAVLVRRRWLMAAVFLIVFVLTFAYALLRPDLYTYSGSLAIGQIIEGDGLVPIEPPEVVQGKLAQIYIPAVIREHTDSAPTGARLNAAVNDDIAMVTLTAEAPAEQGTRYITLIDAAAQQVIAAHQQRIASARETAEATVRQLEETLATYQGLIGDLREQRAHAKRQVAELNTLLNESDNGQSAGLVTLMQNLITSLREQVQSLGKQLVELLSARAPVMEKLTALRSQLPAMEPTRLVAQPAQSLRPSGPGSFVIIALGAILGAMLAVFAAFGFEFVTRANSAIRKGKAG